jgi:hypothetical protein
MTRSPRTIFVALGLLDLLSGPTSGLALDDSSRETTPSPASTKQKFQSTSSR